MSLWRCLQTAPEELRLDTTLKCGQSFRWKLSGEDEWSCAFKGRLVTLRQTQTSVLFRTYPSHSKSFSSNSPKKQTAHQIQQDLDRMQTFLTEYFQLHLKLTECYERWSAADQNFAKVARQFQGIRMLRQDPVENLICFICSSNNNISRISQMIEKLCRTYGNKVYTLNGEDYYDFPTLEKLAQSNVDDELKKLGFGYRAKYISQTANHILHMIPEGKKWLFSLRNADYKEAHSALLQLSGVGPKVADCVCLMSLDKQNAIPVDTHVWQIAKRIYGFGTKGASTPKTLTSRMYEAIADHFRTLFGEYSGWAHSVLFTADLKAFEKRNEVDSLAKENSVMDKEFISTKVTLMSKNSIKREPLEKDMLNKVIKKKSRKDPQINKA
ncbi:hypothetical protein G9A89_011849 [Geosiphon pyriformis]|nr:hypothetical protein G9A89_011849 [Geosiphon pyriformis]